MFTGWRLSTKNSELKRRVSGCFSTGVPRESRVSPQTAPLDFFQCSEKKEEGCVPLLLLKPSEQHKGPWNFSFFWMIYSYKGLPAGWLNLHLRQVNIPRTYSRSLNQHLQLLEPCAWEYTLGNHTRVGFTLHLQKPPHPCVIPTYSYWSGSQGYRGEGLPQCPWETEKNPRREEKENSRSWIIEWITFVWAPGETARETEIHPLFFNALSGMWEATGESNLWPMEAAATSLGRQRLDP